MTPVPWTTADYAFIVSLSSAAVSLLSLGWNIWSKFFLPKAKVSVSWTPINPKGQAIEKQGMLLEAVNLGPTEIILREPVCPTKFGRMWSPKAGWWSLRNLSRDLAGGKSTVEEQLWPRKLAVGESLTVVVSLSAVRAGIQNRALGLGFMDTFDRFHIIPASGYKKVINLVERPNE